MGQIHVWVARLEQPDQVQDLLWAFLSPDERARADRFRFPQHHRRFVVARGALRTILAAYLRRNPVDIGFSIGPQGKPCLAPLPESPPLRFNLSHSHELALYAVVCGSEVGIDLEHLRPVPDAEQIVERCFSPRERLLYQSLPPVDRSLTFFRGWTRKEAFLKWRGVGLTGPLNGVEVAMAPGEPAALLSIDGETTKPAAWSMHDVSPDAEYVAALVVEGDGWSVSRWRWDPGLVDL